MNDELAALQSKVNGVIYNPFVNLKDLAKTLKTLVTESGNNNPEAITKLDAALLALDQFENLPTGNIERIKGFNKVKSNILKVIKELQAPTT
jgi:hypothetical protein